MVGRFSGSPQVASPFAISYGLLEVRPPRRQNGPHASVDQRSRTHREGPSRLSVEDSLTSLRG